MKHFILIIVLACLVHNIVCAQEWLLIEKVDDVDTYIRIDSISSSQNETQFYAVLSPKLATAWQKQYQYETLPAYELKSYCYNDEFNHMATRKYSILDKDNTPLYESFHGFLTFDTIAAYRPELFANWAYLLKEFGREACVFASQTQYNNDNAQWIKFSEDLEMERFIRVDLYSAEDSLVMFKILYKPKASKELQKDIRFPEPPICRIFVNKIQDNGQKVLQLAVSFWGKKNSLTPILVPKFEESEVDVNDIVTQYIDWASLLFEQGKDAVIEKSNSLFGNNTKK